MTDNGNPKLDTLAIEIADTNHTSELADILVSSFYNFPEILTWVSPLLKFTIAEDLRYRLRNNSSLYCCFMASAKWSDGNKEIVGTAEVALNPSFWSSKPQYPYISNLAVKDSFRRQGIGKKLLQQCEQIVWNWGYRETRLHVLEKNNSARQLYVSCGYKTLGTEFDINELIFHNSRRLFLGKKLY